MKTPPATHPIQDRLGKIARTQAELATALGFDTSTLSNKLAGRRRFTQEEITATLQFFRDAGEAVTYEQLFAAELVEAAS